MKAYNYLWKLLSMMLVFTLLTIEASFAQPTLRYYTILGVGLSSPRGLNSSLNDVSHTIVEGDSYLTYRLDEVSGPLIRFGVGLEGEFSPESSFGWDAGLYVRSSSFRMGANVTSSNEAEVFSDAFFLPDFGGLKTFRYWAVELPLAINYRIFDWIGATAGIDLRYQISSNISNRGKLEKTVGYLNTVSYRHRFQAGANAGLYSPITNKLRVDVKYFSDVLPQLELQSVGARRDNWEFREMGFALNTRYYFRK